MRLLHSGPGRCRNRAADREPLAIARRDPRGDVGKPVPLRGIPQDRAGDPSSRPDRRMTARLVRAETEMEGRVTEVWTLVDDEGSLEQWPPSAGLALVGRPAPRQDGALRAAGRASYTVDIRVPGMLHTAV